MLGCRADRQAVGCPVKTEFQIDSEQFTTWDIQTGHLVFLLAKSGN